MSVPPEQVDAVEAFQRLEILEWLAGKLGTPADEMSSPQDPRPERLLEADNSPDPKPAPEPKKAENCGFCEKPLPTLRSAASRYCDRYCAKAARKARATELPRYYRDAPEQRCARTRPCRRCPER
jgi:hypothetical protein